MVTEEVFGVLLAGSFCWWYPGILSVIDAISFVTPSGVNVLNSSTRGLEKERKIVDEGDVAQVMMQGIRKKKMRRIHRKRGEDMLLRLLLMALILFVSGDAADFYNYDCPPKGYMYEAGSLFELNLNNTLSTAVPAAAANASLSPPFFSNLSSDGVYALFLCRGDIVDLQHCQHCVQQAARKIVQVCRFVKVATVYYQQCTLRYANYSIFSHMDVSSCKLQPNYTSTWGRSELKSYQSQFKSAMAGLINQTAHNMSRKGFGMAQLLVIQPSQTLHGLAQCTPDILGDSCQECLQEALKQRDNSWVMTRVFLPSCLLRFDIYGTPPPPSPSPPPPDPSTPNILPILLPSAIAILALIAAFFFWRSRPRQPQDPPIEVVPAEANIPEPNDVGRPVTLLRFTYSEVDSMTGSLQRKLGEGGFGVVYYGRLTNGGKEVAVKVLSNDAPKQLSTEIEVFGKISHKNLVSLIGYCQEGTNLALIYEYMAKGDLKVLLSGSELLSWKERLEIAIDSAQGLDYLHNGCKPPIVHRDVKTPNILVNQHLQAKIADFGFSKIFPEEHVSVLSTRVIGSPGYVDPQYHLTGQLNEKSDVYSFGVVLLELITGKAALLPGNTNLVKWVRPLLDSGDLDNIVEQRLQSHIQNRSSLWRATDLAMECVGLDAGERPTMSEIVTQLKECLAVETGSSRSPRGAPYVTTQQHIISAPVSFDTMAPAAR